jgi:hypothetical protein
MEVHGFRFARTFDKPASSDLEIRVGRRIFNVSPLPAVNTPFL